MCGRYFINVLPETLKSEFGAEKLLQYDESFNLTPSQMAPVVCAVQGQRHLVSMRWGLIPSWAKDHKIGHKLSNARSETVTEKPSFRTAFSRRRCIVPMSGYYEWRKTETGKQPFAIFLPNGNPLAAAGLWEKWRAPDQATIVSFTIITRASEGALKEVHHRMPVFLGNNQLDTWLGGDQSDAEQLMKNKPTEVLAMHPVSTAVNSPRNNSAQLLDPL